MNRRVWVCVGLIFGVAFVTSGARGQALPGLPTNIKNATNAASYVKDIRQFLVDQTVRLQSPDLAAQTAARQKLISECPGNTSVSPSYYAVYCAEWSNAAKALIAPASPLRLRLNVAIVTSGLAAGASLDNSKTNDLEPIIDLILADREGSVALWGIRAAKSLVPFIVQHPGGVAASKMIPALVGSVNQHTKSDPAKPNVDGYIVVDAYHALALREIPGVDPKTSPIPIPQLLEPLVSPVLDILELRLTQYANGAVPIPGAERDVTTFLSSGVYLAANKAEQARVRQDLVTLITYSGERAALLAGSPAELSQLRDMLKYASQGMVVIADSSNYAGLDSASAFQWLRSIPPSATPGDIVTRTRQVWQTVQLGFKDLPKPPPIPEKQPPAPTPAPAAPTTPAGAPPSP